MFKELERVIMNTLPYSCLPALIIINTIYFVIMWSDVLPYGTGISMKYSPR